VIAIFALQILVTMIMNVLMISVILLLDVNNACTEDSRDCPTSGDCEYNLIDCNDYNACTDDNCCPEAGCQYSYIVCDDYNACNEDSCDEDIGCVFTDISAQWI